jgi:hypothetical protein
MSLVYWFQACKLAIIVITSNQQFYVSRIVAECLCPLCLMCCCFWLANNFISSARSHHWICYSFALHDEPPLTIRMSLILCLRYRLFSAGTRTAAIQRLLYNESPLVLTSDVIYLFTARFTSCTHITSHSVWNSRLHTRMRWLFLVRSYMFGLFRFPALCLDIFVMGW